MRIQYQVVPFHELETTDLYDVLKLRMEVFVVEQDCPYQDLDDLDRQALHLLGRAESGAIESYARLLPVGSVYAGHAAIGRVITSARCRGTGEGRRLMEEAIRQTRRAFGGGVPIRIGAQDHALDFYRRLGFEVAGEGYLEDGIPHSPMVLAPETDGAEGGQGTEDPTPELAGPVELRPLHPRVRLLWRLTTGFRGVFWTALAAGIETFGRDLALVDAVIPEALPPGWFTAGVALFWALILLVIPGVRYRRWRYALRPDNLWIRRGILVHRVSVIPYGRLQFVDTRQGPLERWMGLTELVVHTAAPGTSGLIPGLEAEEAELLREALARFGPDVPDAS
ncbi:MAG: GNAT family N-acetyltransferase [Gemmatimonadales bacterium]|nr:MAG: GNAT family N-acetyltransferase [Gemmatimonadales bacterium]